MKTLVVGAREGSLGEAIVEALQHHLARNGNGLPEIYTAGLHDEDLIMDTLKREDRRRVIREVKPELIVCTVGLNEPASVDGTGYVSTLVRSLVVNVVSVMALLNEWIEEANDWETQQFVAISSNSAHIARTGSGPYCASKAALSMALRVAARESKGSPIIWAVEPGLLDGTPMTQGTIEDFPEADLHRIPGVNPMRGLSVGSIANHIVTLALNGGMELNGTTIRLDGGEQ